jgi:hypothetical protein
MGAFERATDDGKAQPPKRVPLRSSLDTGASPRFGLPDRPLLPRDIGHSGLPGLRDPPNDPVSLDVSAVRAVHRRLRGHPFYARGEVVDPGLLAVGNSTGRNRRGLGGDGCSAAAPDS